MDVYRSSSRPEYFVQGQDEITESWASLGHKNIPTTCKPNLVLVVVTVRGITYPTTPKYARASQSAAMSALAPTQRPLSTHPVNNIFDITTVEVRRLRGRVISGHWHDY